MSKRFSRYKFALGAVDGNAPAGTPLGKYKDYKSGTVKPTYTRNAASNPGNLVQAFVLPFSTTGNVKYAIQYSQRAQLNLADAGLSAATLRISESGGEGPISNPGFTPARATVQTRGSGTTNEISKITGVQYKKASGAESSTFPMGRGGDSGEFSVFMGVAQAVKAAVEAKQARNSVSFQPEKFRL